MANGGHYPEVCPPPLHGPQELCRHGHRKRTRVGPPTYSPTARAQTTRQCNCLRGLAPARDDTAHSEAPARAWRSPTLRGHLPLRWRLSRQRNRQARRRNQGHLGAHLNALLAREVGGQGCLPNSSLAIIPALAHKRTYCAATAMSASLIGRPGSSAFRLFHYYSVDVARGLVLLFGLGTRALPSWDSKTRWNNLLVDLAVD